MDALYHQQALLVHRLRLSAIVGGLLTVFCGAAVPPWLWQILQWSGPWLWHLLFSAHRPLHTAPFPDLWAALAHPNPWFGLLWLIYYLITWLIASDETDTTSHPTQHARAWYTDATNCLCGTNPQQEVPRHGYIWKSEQKWELIQKCYQQYQKALQRFDPIPIQLEQPEHFAYHRCNLLSWTPTNTLVLPEHLLTPEHIHLLLPTLAHHLAWQHKSALEQVDLSKYPSKVPLPWLLILTGNFLWLPVQQKKRIAQQIHQAFVNWKVFHIHDADEFAVLLGQGPELEHRLRVVQDKMDREGIDDPNHPLVRERIGHLEVLNKQERKAMSQLGLLPPEPPLVAAPPPIQLSAGSTKKKKA